LVNGNGKNNDHEDMLNFSKSVCHVSFSWSNFFSV
jgi:hypothetical protein